jgi:hypothetical protein
MDPRERNAKFHSAERWMTLERLGGLFLFCLSMLTCQASHAEPLPLATPTEALKKCVMSAEDKSWIERALGVWHVVERRELLLTPSPLPAIVAIDATCEFVANPRGDDRLVWEGTRHSETITFPDGNTAPFGVVSFAAPDHGATTSGFFAMSLPSVWRAKGIQSGLGLERLMDGVLLHEMTHTRQFYFVNPRMEQLTAQYKLSDDIGDDSLQDAYQTNQAYVADYEAERDLLYAAAAARTDIEARALARQALAKMCSRRSKWFVGAAEKWKPLDEIFLTMEGLGQWAAYAWFTDKDGPNLDPVRVLPEIRRKRNRWTQDEGLALILVVDRLVHGWQKLAFAQEPELAESLLERATR